MWISVKFKIEDYTSKGWTTSAVSVGGLFSIPEISEDLAYSFETYHRGKYKLESINFAFPNFLQISITSGSYNLWVTPAEARCESGVFRAFWTKRHMDSTLVNIDTLTQILHIGVPYEIGVEHLTDASREPN